MVIRERWTHLQMLSKVAAVVKKFKWSIIKYRVQYKDNYHKCNDPAFANCVI